MAAQTDATDTQYELSVMSEYLDFISVKTFDASGGQDKVTAHHSSLYSENNANVDYVMQFLMKQGAPAGKLLLGFPSHARSFTLSTTATGLGAPISGPANPGPFTQQIGLWSYYETCSFLRGTSVHWIDGQKVPYAVKGSQWVGFDNQRSYNAKVDYLKSKRLGGAAVWTLDMDDFSGQFCEQGKYPLISQLKHKLSEDWTTQETTPAVLHPTDSSSPSEGTQPTQDPVITTKLDTSCFHNITVVYPVSSFCTRRADGLYVRSDNPKTFYRCVLRKTYVTKCHTLGTEHSSGVTIIPSQNLVLVSFVTATLLLLFSVWTPGDFALYSLSVL
ncbi:acidic mammalian chitinase-like [Epinephelus lanceolatus]